MLGAGVAAVNVSYVNVSNPAAFGVQWIAEGNRYTLVNPRGTAALWFGVKRDGRWVSHGRHRPVPVRVDRPADLLPGVHGRRPRVRAGMT